MCIFVAAIFLRQYLIYYFCCSIWFIIFAAVFDSLFLLQYLIYYFCCNSWFIIFAATVDLSFLLQYLIYHFCCSIWFIFAATVDLSFLRQYLIYYFCCSIWFIIFAAVFDLLILFGLLAGVIVRIVKDFKCNIFINFLVIFQTNSFKFAVDFFFIFIQILSKA